MKLFATIFLTSALSLSALAASTPAIAAPTVINFDDLPGDVGNPIHDGYAGLDWSNFFAISALDTGNLGSGYANGTVSAPNVAFNGFADPASFSSHTAFNLLSVEVTKALFAGVTHFDGYVGNTLTYSMDVSSTTAGPTLATFNWWNLNKVVMSDGDYTAHRAIDNLTIAAVPEPETDAMLLAGLGLLGWMARRKAARNA